MESHPFFEEKSSLLKGWFKKRPTWLPSLLAALGGCLVLGFYFLAPPPPSQYSLVEAPFHADFSKATLLIERGEYQEALEKAVCLKQTLALQKEGLRALQPRQSAIYAHNLLRIAFLQQALKNVYGEKAAWEELESFLEKEKDARACRELLTTYSENGVDLRTYIKERKKQLP